MNVRLKGDAAGVCFCRVKGAEFLEGGFLYNYVLTSCMEEVRVTPKVSTQQAEQHLCGMFSYP
jgi:hypothetical protein